MMDEKPREAHSCEITAFFCNHHQFSALFATVPLFFGRLNVEVHGNLASDTLCFPVLCFALFYCAILCPALVKVKPKDPSNSIQSNHIQKRSRPVRRRTTPPEPWIHQLYCTGRYHLFLSCSAQWMGRLKLALLPPNGLDGLDFF